MNPGFCAMKNLCTSRAVTNSLPTNGIYQHLELKSLTVTALCQCDKMPLFPRLDACPPKCTPTSFLQLPVSIVKAIIYCNTVIQDS